MAETSEPKSPTRASFFSPESSAPIYAGIAVVLAGFVVIAITWGLVAGEPEIYRQLPFIMSGGFTGLALVIIGAAVLGSAIWRRESAARRAQYEELAAILREKGVR